MATDRSPRAARHSQQLDDQLCFAVYSTMLGLNKVYRRLLKEFGLTYPQYLVMLVLWERDDVPVSAVCERLFLDTATVTPLLKRLESDGLLSRQRSKVDERQVLIRLTAAGKALRERAAELPGCVAAAMQRSGPQIAQMREALKSLRGSLFDSTA
jgi:DNA-binding MarR family transcriptional regulator